MVKIEIVKSLALEIKKKFSKTEANKIIDLLYTLEESPHKGKILTNVAGIVIKELKYKTKSSIGDHISSFLICLVSMQFILSDKGLYLLGIDSQVFLPIITAFCLFAAVTSVVIFLKYFRSAERCHGIVLFIPPVIIGTICDSLGVASPKS